MKQLRIVSIFVALVIGMLPVRAIAADPPAGTPAGNRIETLEVGRAADRTVVKIGFGQALTGKPAHFSIATPARLVFDLPDTGNALGYSAKAINEGGLRSLNVVQAGDRSRLVLNMDKVPRFESGLEGKALLISLFDETADAVGTPAVQHFAAGNDSQTSHGLRDIKFRRGTEGEGIIEVDLTTLDTGVDIRQQGSKLEVIFRKSWLPDFLNRRLDVVDFATPVTSITTHANGDDVRMEISPQGLWEHMAFQSDKRFVITVKPVKEDQNRMIQGTKSGYQGDLISLNFQNIPLRELLHVFSEISNFNIVLSDSVAGNISLKLNDVPWDQALDMVLQQKNLSMRKSGNVLRIAPRDELAAIDKQQLESHQQIMALEQPQTESFQINYQKAVDIQKLLGSKDQPILSEVGSVLIDEYSNKVFVTDIPSRIDRIRGLISSIDKPSDQVQIEARIVEADKVFTRALGARMSLFNTQPVRAASLDGRGVMLGGGFTTPAGPGEGAMAVSNLPPSSSHGAVSFSLYNASLTRILNLELLAMEEDGRGRRISSPRLVTGNNIKAIIEDGVDIPIVTPGTGTNPPTVQYKKAKVSLGVTPQITPDGRVRMKLEISNDRPDFSRNVLGNLPIISSKIETDVVVENGGTIGVGGVTVISDTTSENRIPFFGDLPYIGFLFKQKEKNETQRELLIFITPKVIDNRLAVR